MRRALAAHAIKAHLDHRVPKANQAEMETTVRRVNPERMEKMRNFYRRNHLSLASFAHQDPLDLTAQWVPKARLDLKDLLASHPAMAFLAILVWLVNLGLWDDQDEKELEVPLALPVV